MDEGLDATLTVAVTHVLYIFTRYIKIISPINPLRFKQHKQKVLICHYSFCILTFQNNKTEVELTWPRCTSPWPWPWPCRWSSRGYRSSAGRSGTQRERWTRTRFGGSGFVWKDHLLIIMEYLKNSAERLICLRTASPKVLCKTF